MFNKRHYEAIALVMQNMHPGPDASTIDHDTRLGMWHDIAGELAQLFGRDNPQFDRGRFMHACLSGQNVKAKTAHLKAVRS